MKKFFRILLLIVIVLVPVLSSTLPVAYASPQMATVEVVIQPNADESNDSFLNGLSTDPLVNGFSSTIALGTGSNISYYSRPVIYFNLSSVPSYASISSAKISVVNLYTTPNALTIQAYRLNEQFDERYANWTNRVSATPWISAGGTYDTLLGSTSVVAGLAAYSTIEINLSANEIQKYLSGDKTNYGFLLKADNEGTSQRIVQLISGEYFVNAAYRPKLVITYNIADPTATPTPSPTMPMYPTLNAEQFTLSSGNAFDVERRTTFGEVGVMLTLLCLGLPLGSLAFVNYLNRKR